MNFKVFSRCLATVLRPNTPKKESKQFLTNRCPLWRITQHSQSFSTLQSARFNRQEDKQVFSNSSEVPYGIQARNFTIGRKLWCEKNDEFEPIRNPSTIRGKIDKFDYSGELAPLRRLDPKDTLFVFNSVEELKDAPEVVQKLCSVEFADRLQKRFHRIFAMKDTIRKVCGVEHRREMIVANMTLQIRATIHHLQNFPRDMQAKRFVVEKIAKRKRELRRLRAEDYERFLWLMNKLEIKYVPPSMYTRKETKYGRRKRLAREEAFQMKAQKLDELKARLDAEKVLFSKEKDVIMKEIEMDLTKFNIDREDVLKKVEEKRRAKLGLD
ncbi:uncharacterized protein LOC132557332 [Ylistrum balloti]|uniref:uncharacterized protein LOC132557332 n=1 Tax=Ylistrum balloti TaxID=509963 RepID=UPI002905F681|nr:uncharacterized protein LOC132557332 [Ylistrum balloti]